MAGALSIEQGHRKIVCANRIIMFQNCVFTNNTSTTGSAEAVLVADEIFEKYVHTAVSSEPKDTFNYDISDVYLSSQHMDVFYNCTFHNSAIAHGRLGETDNSMAVLLLPLPNRG